MVIYETDKNELFKLRSDEKVKWCSLVFQAVLAPGGGGLFFKEFQSICFGFGFALMIGILASGGVSGGHLNPGANPYI